MAGRPKGIRGSEKDWWPEAIDMKHRGLDDKAIADRFGIHHTTVYRFFRSRTGSNLFEKYVANRDREKDILLKSIAKDVIGSAINAQLLQDAPKSIATYSPSTDFLNELVRKAWQVYDDILTDPESSKGIRQKVASDILRGTGQLQDKASMDVNLMQGIVVLQGKDDADKWNRIRMAEDAIDTDVVTEVENEEEESNI